LVVSFADLRVLLPSIFALTAFDPSLSLSPTGAKACEVLFQPIFAFAEVKDHP